MTPFDEPRTSSPGGAKQKNKAHKQFNDLPDWKSGTHWAASMGCDEANSAIAFRAVAFCGAI